MDDRGITGVHFDPKFCFHVVSETPPIFIHDAAFEDSSQYLDLIGTFSRGKKVHLLCLLYWTLHGRGERLQKDYHKIKRDFPGIELSYLCNSTEEFSLAKEAGLPAIFLNQNALLDDNIFKPIDRPKIYDAIYNAGYSPYKRHELASEVGNLALIGLQWVDDKIQIEFIQKKLPQAKHLNYSEDGGFIWINTTDIPSHLSQARVGLCLSAEEGAMYASAEYLLCGLPVVSTKSRGGRDVFFDEEYVRIVDDDPGKIKAAVDELVRLNIPPDYIRDKTLQKMRWHRDQFNELVKHIIEKEGGQANRINGWCGNYTNKMATGYTRLEIRSALEKIERITETGIKVLPWNGHDAALSLCFGGGDPSHYLDLVVPELSKHGFFATFNLTGGYFENQEEWTRSQDWGKTARSGHQIGNFFLNLSRPSGLQPVEEQKQVKKSREILERMTGLPVNTFAFPFFEVSEDLKIPVAQNNFLAQRGEYDHSILSADSEPDWLNIPTRILDSQFSIDVFEKEVNLGVFRKSWGCYSINSIEGAAWGWAPLSFEVFMRMLDYLALKKDFLWIAPFGTVGAYWKAQKTIENTLAIRKKGQITLTWEIPDLFPENVSLKVRLSRPGSKIFQSERQLRPNEQNIFEISFDQKNLTIELSSPSN